MLTRPTSRCSFKRSTQSDACRSPAIRYTAFVGTTTTLPADDFETDQGWTVENGPAFLDGAWERNVPADDGTDAHPLIDHDASGQCTFTDNTPGNSDVDGGPTVLISPTVDLSDATDPILRYARRWANDDQGGDPFDIEVSNDRGDTWLLIERVTSTPQSRIERTAPLVGVLGSEPLTTNRVVRFSATDSHDNSIDEGGLDAFSIIDIQCSDWCPCPSRYLESGS